MAAKIFKIIFTFILWCIILVALLGAVVQSKTFQQWAIGKATDYLSKELQTKVSVGGFRVKNLTSLHIDSILIEDRQRDTAFYIRELTVSLDRIIYNPTEKTEEVRVGYAKLSGAYINFRKYKAEDKDWNYEFIIDYFNKKDTTDTIPGKTFELHIDKLEFEDNAFAMRQADSERDTVPPGVFNPSDFKFQKLSGTFDKFSIVDDSIYFNAKGVSLDEKNGFHIRNFSARSHIYNRGLEFINLLVETEKSRLTGDLKMNYNDWDELSEFIPKVQFTATLNKSTVSMEDVGFWGEGAQGLKQVAEVSGKARGTIDNLKAKDLVIRAGKETYIAGDLSIKGLPDFETSYLDVKLTQARTRESDIEQLFELDSLPAGIKKMGLIKFTGKFTGFPKSFVAYGRFYTDLGRITSDLKLDFMSGDSSATYSGLLRADNFDLGKFIDQEKALGKITFSANVDGKGLTPETADAVVKGSVSSIRVEEYTYKNITIDGEYVEQVFTGYADIRDENLDLDFDGSINFASDTPEMNFVSVIRKADLYKLGFDSVPSLLTAKLDLNFTGSNIDNIYGKASVSKLQLQRQMKVLKIDTIALIAGHTGRTRRLKLYSDVVDAEIVGEYNFSKLPDALHNYAAHLLPQIVKRDTIVKANENFNFSINFKKPHILTNFIQEDFFIEPFEARGSINTSTNDVQLNLRAALFRYGDMEFRHIGINTLPPAGGMQSIVLKCASFIKGDSMLLENVTASLIFHKQYVGFDIQVPTSITRLSADLKGTLRLTENEYSLVFSDSKIVSAIHTWRISDSSYIAYQPKAEKLVFSDVRLSSVNESILVNGTVGGTFSDTLRFDFNNFSLANVNYFTRPPKGQEVGGRLNGNIALFNLSDVPLFTSNLKADSLAFGPDTLGSLRLTTLTDQSQKHITINGSFHNGRLEGSTISGNVNLAKNVSSNFNVKFSLHNATTRLIEPFLTGIASEFTGNFSTDIYLRGTLTEPDLGGTVALGGVSFKIDYLQTRYFVDTAVISISKTKFSISPFTLRDEKGTPANASGYISHNSFKDFAVNFNVTNMNRFMALNTQEKDNSMYFGTAYMTGNFHISGPFNDLYMEVNAKSEKGTFFNLQFVEDGSVGSYDFITFVDYKNQKVTESSEVNLEGIRLNLNLTVTPDAQIRMIFDNQFGDEIIGSGYADLRMEINTLGDFKMYGTFVIEQGKYALDIADRDFVVRKGGTITWTGDPLTARIDIRAVYTTYTTPQPLVMGLVADTDLPKYGASMPVEAIIHMRGQLMKPDIRFAINIPDISSLTGSNANTSVLFNVLRRIENDQEEMSRQVFSLLVLRSFVTPADNGYMATESSGGPGLSSSVTTGVSRLLTNKITDWLTKYDPRWNIGVQVGQNQTYQRTDVIVMVSRKWLNDRLQLDATADNTSQGNISVSYKLTPNGNYQVRAFSSNTNNVIYNQNILSFGTGFYIRTEFEDFGELKRNVKNMFKRKSKKTATPPPKKEEPKKEEPPVSSQ